MTKTMLTVLANLYGSLPVLSAMPLAEAHHKELWAAIKHLDPRDDWRTLKGFPGYFVSREGHILSVLRSARLKKADADGRVALSRGGRVFRRSINALMNEAFDTGEPLGRAVLTEHQRQEVHERVERKEPREEIAQRLGISRATVWRVHRAVQDELDNTILI